MTGDRLEGDERALEPFLRKNFGMKEGYWVTITASSRASLAPTGADVVRNRRATRSSMSFAKQASEGARYL
ncbi:MAG TPA: hypothetical protein DIW52_18770 [Pseudomonas sp.]|nr:hypothetical protein [Pseudomonas sp.]